MINTTNTQESSAAILREMRNWWPHDPLKYPNPEERDNKDLCSFADRLEAALKRENSAMRKALENSNGLLAELAAIGEWGETAREQIAENISALLYPHFCIHNQTKETNK